MRLVNELSEKALGVANETQNHVDMDAVEKYYMACGLWIRYSPIPTRPILNTAWFEVGILAESSIFLTIHGFYEQACANIRMQLDGFLVRLYWDTLERHQELQDFSIEDRLTNGYWEWERGEAEDYPKPKDDIFPKLREEKNFQAYNSHYQLTKEINAQNKLLNQFIHGRPSSRYSEGANRSGRLNIQFDKNQFDIWFSYFRETYNLMTVMSILLYPSYLECASKDEFILLESNKLNRLIGILRK